MQYMGGKSRIARQIAEFINEIPRRKVQNCQAPGPDNHDYSGERFDSSEFWRAMRLLADTGHTVFVSEQEAPPGIECIWEKPFTRTLDRNKGNQFTVTEKLFYLPARRHGPCTW